MVQQSSKRPREDITPEPSAKKLNDQSGSVLEEPVETTSDRATQKLLRLQRKASKTPLFELIQELKKLWEQIRMKNLPKQSRKQVVSSTVQMVKGSIHDLIFKHDASRIVQSLIKYSDADTDRRDILKELQGHYVEMSQSAYGRFAVLKALKYAPNAALRSQIIQEFVESKSAIKLIRKKMSAIIVDTVYCLYANGKERQLIIEEFYGAEYALTKSCITSNSNGKRWDLTEILQAYPDRKQRILSQMQDILRGIIGKEGTIGPNEIIHR
jgi:pumilio family protein 6